MTTENSAKMQSLLWWITSIAVSVLCCSVLFVLFASYLVDVKAMIRETDMRVSVLEEHDARLTAEIEAMQKHAVTPPVEIPASAQSAAPTDAMTPESAPTVAMPATPEGAVPPASPGIQVPSIAPPTISEPTTVVPTPTPQAVPAPAPSPAK